MLEAVDTCFFVFNSVPDKYKTQDMSDTTIDDFLPALKLFPIGLLQVRWLKTS